MDSPPDPVTADDELYSGRKLKIRRSPSSRKVSAGLPAETSSSSFHGRSRTTVNQQPLIIHTFDPEIIVTEPDEFMWVVQRLTGSLDTRRSLRASKRKRKEVQAPMQVQDVQLVQQSNYCSLMEEDAQICTGAALMMAGDSSTAKLSVKDHPSSPLCSNSSDLSSNYCINPLVSHLSCDTNYQLNYKISPPSSSNYYSNHSNKYPSPPISCNYNPLPLINHSINPNTLTINPNPSLLPPNPSNPSALTINSNPSPSSLNPNTIITMNNNHSPSFPSPSCPLTINPNPSPLSPNPNNFTDNNDLTSPLSPMSCNSGITNHMASPISSIIKPTDQRENNRGQPGSPSSPATSGLTTSSEDCTTDLSTESCASPMQELFSPKQGSYNNMDADEDESNFFLFSFDSYYGSLHAAQDGLGIYP